MLDTDLGVAIIAGIFSVVSLFLSARVEHRITKLEEGKVSKGDCVGKFTPILTTLTEIKTGMVTRDDCLEAFLKVDWMWKTYESEAAARLKNPPQYDDILDRIEKGETTYDVLESVEQSKKNEFLEWLRDQAVNGDGEKKVKARILLGMHAIQERLR